MALSDLDMPELIELAEGALRQVRDGEQEIDRMMGLSFLRQVEAVMSARLFGRKSPGSLPSEEER